MSDGGSCAVRMSAFPVSSSCVAHSGGWKLNVGERVFANDEHGHSADVGAGACIADMVSDVVPELISPELGGGAVR